MDPLIGQRSSFPKRSDLSKKWVVVDANNKILGRLTTQIALLLQGKDKANYQPGQLVGDSVIVINAAKVRVTGKKAEQKEYRWHSGFYGGMKKRSYKDQMKVSPEEVIKLTVRGMLPKTKYGNALMGRLRVFSGAEHNLAGQKPETKEIKV